MSRVGRRKTARSKQGTEPSKLSEKGSKASHQTDITQFFCSKEDSESTDNGLPECALPSPDDAALPCSTSLCSESDIKSVKNDKDSANEKVIEEKKDVPDRKSQKISDMTNKVLVEVPKKKKNKNKNTQVRNHQVTEFFPVRRSNRKPLPAVIKEKQKVIEEALLSGNEDGFEIKEFPGKGRGVVSKTPIKRGDFVLEYHGELISPEEAKEREMMYSFKENTGCYMYYFRYSDKRYCVDATKESGRLGRLINHSKKGNLRTQPLYAQDCPRLAFFALRDIEPGEELCYDYGDRRKVALESHPWLAL